MFKKFKELIKIKILSNNLKKLWFKRVKLSNKKNDLQGKLV